MLNGGTSAATAAGGTPSLQPRQVHRIVAYIEEHLGRPIRVAELSQVVYRTQAHFSRLFKQTFGLPPHAYVLRRRIEVAARLMSESDIPLCQVALKCGFTDQSHFCKRFRQHMGATPSAWRRMHRTNRPRAAETLLNAAG